MPKERDLIQILPYWSFVKQGWNFTDVTKNMFKCQQEHQGQTDIWRDKRFFLLFNFFYFTLFFSLVFAFGL
jgi:hypothetical protein